MEYSLLKKISNLLKESMSEMWMLYLFAFLMGTIVGGCMTFNYILTDHNETLHALLDSIRSK